MATAAVNEIAGLTFLKRPNPGLSVWQLRRSSIDLRGHALQRKKVQVLSALGLPTVSAFLEYSEDPIADEVPGEWKRATEGTWRIPTDTDLHAMVGWLYLGGWVLYGAVAPADTEELLSIGFSPKAEEVSKAVKRLGLGFIVISFHDDSLWTVALGRDAKS